MLLVLTAPVAVAKSFRIVDARVLVGVHNNGSVTVAEHLTFSFDGTFQGAYRDIPIRPGEVITSIAVSEAGVAYAPGAPTALGSSGDAGTFGVENLGSRIRVVWHYRATNEDRTFAVTYQMEGLAVVYDDVVDVNLKVWGDEWEFGLDHLESEMLLPAGAVAGDVLVWGHAATTEGATDLGADGVSPRLEASGVPERQFVEFRVLFPRGLLTETDGATVVAGPGRDGILAEESAREVRDEEAIEAAERFVHERNVTLWTLLFLMLPIPVASRHRTTFPPSASPLSFVSSPPKKPIPCTLVKAGSKRAALSESARRLKNSLPL